MSNLVHRLGSPRRASIEDGGATSVDVFPNPNVAEHHGAEAIVELQSDGAGLRPRRFSGAFRHDLPVEAHPYAGVARLDLHAVPSPEALRAGFGGHQAVDAAGGVCLPVVVR